jgi:hypothetical protein
LSVPRLVVIALCTSLLGCFPPSRTNARLEPGYTVGVTGGTSELVDRHQSPTLGNGILLTEFELQHAWRFDDGDGFAIQVAGPWPNLDLYYAFDDHEGDRWFFGVGADVGLPGQGPYGVATYYLYKKLYITFTPQIPLPVDAIFLAPQLALGADNYSIFVKYLTAITQEGSIDSGGAVDVYDEVGLPPDVWTIGARARF